MDGESRKGKMIEDPLEEDPCCSVFFSAKICSLNGINDKMAFHSIDSLFNKFFEFLYVIALLYILYLLYEDRFILILHGDNFNKSLYRLFI